MKDMESKANTRIEQLALVKSMLADNKDLQKQVDAMRTSVRTMKRLMAGFVIITILIVGMTTVKAEVQSSRPVSDAELAQAVAKYVSEHKGEFVGPAGSTGPSGPQGRPGDTGPMGIQGPMGLTGARGASSSPTDFELKMIMKRVLPYDLACVSGFINPTVARCYW